MCDDRKAWGIGTLTANTPEIGDGAKTSPTQTVLPGMSSPADPEGRGGEERVNAADSPPETAAPTGVRKRSFSFIQRLGRLIHLRLVVPLKRSIHPPEHTARAVMWGLFWGFTPTIGIQMYLVLATWLVLRRNPRFNFNVIVGMAWTWTTNVFTMWPIYYAFYVTGQLMMGRPDQASGYQGFLSVWEAALGVDGVFNQLYAFFRTAVTEQGVPLLIGCIPWAFGTAWLGYRWSLAFVTARRKAREARMRKAREARVAKRLAERQRKSLRGEPSGA